MSGAVMLHSCPTCGHAIAAPCQVKALLDVKVTRQQFLILRELVGRYPRPVSRLSLIDTLYGDDASGGPDAATDNLRVRICALRKVLRPFGWAIQRANGGDVGGYRLEPIK